ncbi:MAG TPA: lipid-A-disaccharide synthase [Acetobacteraceae bacterium]|nr:lipid-A-disaccharide synthase [Acetobacteraceae bacterium]
MTTIWLLAGEASGDILGARLMAALRVRRPDLAFRGVGGPRMLAAGLGESLFPLSDLAVMGLAEILPRLGVLRRRLNEAASDIAVTRPDLVVTIDSPGFTLRLLKRIAPLGIPRIQYVAPQVWAWRESRVKSFPGLWDELLCLLPFEEQFFARHGLPVRFVGHPVLQSGADRGNAARFRARHDIAPDAPVLILMPGSRRNEAPRLLPVFGGTVALLAKDFPNLVPVIPAAPVVEALVRQATAGWYVKPLVISETDEKHDAYAAAGAALTKSGTSTLELALARVPMAVTYRVNPITAVIARRMIKVPHVAMVNLLAGRALVPELLQQDCTAEKLRATVRALLLDQAVATAQRDGFTKVMQSLRAPAGDPADAAALEVLAVLDRPTAGVS